MNIAIQAMIDEHDNIKKVLKIARQMCLKAFDEKILEPEDFFKVIDFVRNYADKFHHGKEEAVLFKLMDKEIGAMATNGPIQGMLIEHDLGRSYMAGLEEALNNYKSGDKEATLNIIANTISYTEMLKRHIHNEDNALFPFAARQLRKEALDQLEAEINEIENNAQTEAIKTKYLGLINELEQKYLI